MEYIVFAIVMLVVGVVAFKAGFVNGTEEGWHAKVAADRILALKVSKAAEVKVPEKVVVAPKAAKAPKVAKAKVNKKVAKKGKK